MEIYDSEAFVGRLTHALRSGAPITWIVGSPLVFDASENLGVPGVQGVVDLVRQELADIPSALQRLNSELEASSNTYQSAFTVLAGYRGQRGANSVIRRAVLRAYAGTNAPNIESDEELRQAESELDSWRIPAGAKALAQLVSSRSSVYRTNILTTNFDPLLEIGIRSAGGNPITIAFHSDGNPTTVRNDQPHVVHLHGFWTGSDTLHAPHQLTQERRQLRAALSSFLRSSIVVVLAYSGWDDVVTSAMADVLSEDVSNPEVIWAFYEKDPGLIRQQYSKALERLAPGFARNRITGYGGIDCHVVLPRVYVQLQGSQRLDDRAPQQLLRDAPMVIRRSRESDAIPAVDLFVGRDSELEKLHHANARVLSISGLGGQGKSILAARFIEEIRHHSLGRRVVIDWRDCKEEGNTAHLSICLFIESVTEGRIAAEAIATCRPGELASVFGEAVRDLAGVLVLDNIDTYVDVENGTPVGTIEAVVQRHLSSTSAFKILLTSRPELRIPHAAFFGLHIDGLTRDAVRELYVQKASSPVTDSDLDRLLQLTGGHPLGIVLLAAQRLSRGVELRELLDELASATSDISRRILRGAYRSLKQEDQDVLRSLAELERPENESGLEEITGLRYNRLTKALRRLVSMNLVINRIDVAGHRLVDLHPLVRQFVRHEFVRKERDSFIGRILSIFSRRVSPYRSQLASGGISQSSLQHWLHMVEILINRESFVEAISEMNAITLEMERQGLVEEQIRLGEKILSRADWSDLLRESKDFRKWIGGVLHAITYFGNHDRVARWLNYYKEHSTRGGADAVVIGSIAAFDAWFRRDFEIAILTAKETRERRHAVDVQLDNDPEHTYRLALRDSGQTREALAEFLEGLTLEQALSGDELKTGTYYGNIGRCLQLGDRINEALAAYKLCFQDFEQNPPTAVNAGYLRYWVGECFEALGEHRRAEGCFIAASEYWTRSSPVLAIGVGEKLSQLRRAFELPLTSIVAEQVFREWGRASA